MLRFEIIWLVALLVGILTGCSDHEILDTYEEVGDVIGVEESETLMPFDFEPYISSQTETSANTRADLNYLSYPANNVGDFRNSHFQFIPSLGIKTGNNSWYGSSSSYNYRFGRTAYNSYMVGVFAYSHGTPDWDIAKASAKANLMTNQPLLRLPINPNSTDQYNHDKIAEKSIWKYTPKKYWPNGDGNKVTFIAYYPFQDYEYMEDGITRGTYYRDGDHNGTQKTRNETIVIDGTSYHDPYNDTTLWPDKDLTCISLPARNATGALSYTFTFKQKDNVKEHVDFLMGITQNQTRKGVADNAANIISLKLCHTLTAVKFNITLNENLGLLTGQTAPDGIEVKINSIGLEGLYTQGKVYPYIDGGTTTFNWSNQSVLNDPSNLVEFDNNNPGSAKLPFIKANKDDRPTFIYEGGSWSKDFNTARNIYNNDKGDGRKNDDAYGSNSRGYRYMLLVIPQYVEKEPDGSATTPAIREPKLVVNYSITYEYSDGSKVHYLNQIDKIPLTDFGESSALFKPGKMLTFNVKFNLRGIQMDAEMMEWDEGEGPVEEGGNGVPVPHEWEDQMDREEEGGTP